VVLVAAIVLLFRFVAHDFSKEASVPL